MRYGIFKGQAVSTNSNIKREGVGKRRIFISIDLKCLYWSNYGGMLKYLIKFWHFPRSFRTKFIIHWKLNIKLWEKN